MARILLVDDEREFIELIEYRLDDRGFEFIEASDGVDALNKAREYLPDLILLDILLPDLDGLSVCEILQRQPSTRQIPVVLMSALSGNVTARAASAHAEDFFRQTAGFGAAGSDSGAGEYAVGFAWFVWGKQ